ncbi:MAG: hypothetical protein LBS96_04355 [Oscillospiraceae bacterium]|jgi:hypothetical protein|nr:hypothetical protein [Oscillospiraceae bacterium]
MPRFAELRGKHPVFHYHGYGLEQTAGALRLRWHFSIDGLCEFHPETLVFTENLRILNDPNSPAAHELLFALGLVEAVSYWKCACPPEVVIHCGSLSEAEIRWWKRLWFGGLGEFFYRNAITTDEESFVRFRCDFVPTPDRTMHMQTAFHSSGLRLVPVGGGKDSCVTLELLHAAGVPLLGFTVNDQPARRETFVAAGFAPEQMLRTRRGIDPALLQRNAEGYWNGHTPFSAIVAFLGLFCAYLAGAEALVLSNEASADEASVPGTQVNHQYSKSFAFEQDMNWYISERFGLPIRYFSLLRPFHELQIACRFAALPQFHGAFKSCNAGSKANAWCGRCAKCLFVWLMLAPFLPQGELAAIFGRNLWEDPALEEELFGLLGLQTAKPFECVGTVEEARAALTLVLERCEATGKAAPPLLQNVPPECRLPHGQCVALLRAFRLEHGVPVTYNQSLERMRNDVSAAAESAGR